MAKGGNLMETKEITSLSNPLIKEVVKLHQKKYRTELILTEGEKSVDEAIKAGLKPKYVFFQKKVKEYNCENYHVNEAVMKKISTTESPSNIVAVFEKPCYSINIFKKFKKIVLLDNIKDQGNLGTIIRCCSAFGVDGILLYGDTTDEYSPKTIRSSTGNIFKIPVLKVGLEEIKQFKKEFKIIGTIVNSNNYFDDYEVKSKIIVMFGSEAKGLSKELINLSDENFTIKMTNDVESLNLALCAGIVLYELQKNCRI